MRNFSDIEVYEYIAENVKLSAFKGYINIENLEILPAERRFHTHEWYEIFIVKKGEIICHFEDKDVCLNEGRILIVKPKYMHYIDGMDTADVFNVNFVIENFGKTKAQFLSFLDFSDFIVLSADNESMMLLSFLEKAVNSNKNLLVGTYLFAFLVKGSELYNRSETGEMIDSDSDASRIYILDNIIEKYYKSDLTLDMIAEKLHISTRQLSRIIKKQYGCTYTQKVINLKMLDAVNMLKKGIAISEIAQACGYSTVSSFYNSFKKNYGISPAEYINKMGM